MPLKLLRGISKLKTHGGGWTEKADRSTRQDDKRETVDSDESHGKVQVGNGIELEAVGLQFEPYRWRPCGVTWDSSRTVVVIKLRRTSALGSGRSVTPAGV